MGGQLGMALPAGIKTHLRSMLATILRWHPTRTPPAPDQVGTADDFQLAEVKATGNLPVLTTQQESPDFAAVLRNCPC